jgi:hypothetical protein
MKNCFVLVLVMLSGISSSFADSVLIAQEVSHQTISVFGTDGGAASEGFSIMDQAGAQSRHEVEGQELIGRNSTATRVFMNPVRYTLNFNIDSQSGYTVVDLEGADSKIKRVQITGAVAEELYGNMQKAGLTEDFGWDSNHIQGVNASCDVQLLGKSQYSCTIDVRK